MTRRGERPSRGGRAEGRPAGRRSALRGGRQAVTVAIRLARRMAWQSRGRSVLVVLLIALPIIGLAGIDTVQASRTASPADTVRLQLGRSEARLQVVSAPDPQLRQDPLTDDTVQSGDPTGESRDPADVLPKGTEILRVTQTTVVAKTAGGIGSLSAFEGSAWDRRLVGKFTLVDGRAPNAAGEILVSPGALVRLGVSLGATVAIQAPRAETVRVVGVLRDADVGDSESVLYGRDGAFGGVSAQDALSSSKFYLPSTVLTWPDVKKLNAQGIVALSRAVVLDPPSASEAPRSDNGSGPDVTLILSVALLGAFALFEVCLLAGAAFAVGARHRQRSLAVLSSVGADRRTIFAVMTTEGAVLGLLGGLLGSGLGIVLAALGEPLISGGRAAQYPAFRVDLLGLSGIVLAAVVSGLLAAAFPARAASRVDIVAAIRGAQRPPRPSFRRPFVGVFVVAAGSVLSLAGGIVIIASRQTADTPQAVTNTGIGLLIAGPITMQIGAILIAPLLLRWVMAAFSRLGAGARLGSRDASRNPSRTVPAIAAIMSTVFVSAFSMCLLAGSQAMGIRDHFWSAPLGQVQVGLTLYDATGAPRVDADRGERVASVLQSTFPGTTARIVSTSPSASPDADPSTTFAAPRLRGVEPGQTSGDGLTNGDHIVVGSVDDLATLLDAPVTAEARAMLASGGAVATSPIYASGGRLTIDTFASREDLDFSKAESLRTVQVNTALQRPVRAPDFGLFLLPETARSLGIPYRATVVIDQVGTGVAQAKQDQLAAALQVVDPGLYAGYETGPDRSAANWSWALLGLTTVIALGASIVAIALARADGRRDDETLAALGSPPRILRSFGFWQGIIIAGLGAVIGVALGLVPAFALGLHPPGVTHGFVPFDPPWLQLAATALAMPLLIALGGWLTARTSRPRVSLRTR
ncbi:hypothetical protein AS850_06230 [Frondihabitans sp. 762G35]|uniref:FtsX-like permease family protein n=1 Tax=Frondihabitans sp. 762G35 TaxID=1446794 RepID=UPI000D21CE4F|nr:FtsX-like permease family protein [Frondihabitans sp. 762G35]ARC56670.1 hypothetical protein AS850_06230 [Frondihabitans sp. 762G35]